MHNNRSTVYIIFGGFQGLGHSVDGSPLMAETDLETGGFSNRFPLYKIMGHFFFIENRFTRISNFSAT